MTIEPELVTEYARAVQGIELPRERAEVVAGELERLVAGGLRAAASAGIANDPADFLAALLELRDQSGE